MNPISQAIPPFIIYKAKTLNPAWMKNGLPGSSYACSDDGWIDTDLFERWLKDHFLKYAVSRRPLLLILYGHKTDYQPSICQYAKDHDVIMFCLTPHSTHMSQPLDTCVFKPLKTQWNKAVHTFQTKNLGVQITKYNFPFLLNEAWNKAMNADNICSGFRDAGIYPLNQENIKATIENEDSETGNSGYVLIVYLVTYTYWCANFLNSLT